MSDQENTGADLRGLVRVIRRRGWVVALCVACGACASLALSLHQPKEYSATATLLFRDPGFAQALFGVTGTQYGFGDPSRAAATNVELISLGSVSNLTAKRFGLSPGQVSSEVSVVSKGQSDLVAITATDRSPKMAAALANAFAADFITVRRNADRTKIQQGQQILDLQIQRLTPSERAGRRGKA